MLVDIPYPRAVGVADQVQPGQAGVGGQPSPQRGQPGQVGDVVGAEQVEHRSAVHGQVPLVREVRKQVFEVLDVVGFPGVVLLLQHLVAAAVPDSGPGLVRPGQTVSMRQARVFQQVRLRTFQEARAAEPVVPVTQCADTVFGGEFPLSPAALEHPEVVEPQVGREARLKVAVEQRTRRRRVRPLGEAASPPAVVLRDRVELGEEEGHDFQGGAVIHAPVPRVRRARRPPRPSPSPERTPRSVGSRKTACRSRSPDGPRAGFRRGAAFPTPWVRSRLG